MHAPPPRELGDGCVTSPISPIECGKIEFKRHQSTAISFVSLFYTHSGGGDRYLVSIPGDDCSGGDGVVSPRCYNR